MKKLVAVSALLASVAAFATSSVTSDNTFGVLKISDTTSQELIISVPWEKVGGGDVKITDLVLPTGLSEGTMLYYYDGSKYMAFRVSEGRWSDGELTGGLTYEANLTIARGSALIIKRTKAANAESYPIIYLSGQYADAAGSSTISIASATAPAYSLIAPTKTASVSSINLNDATWTNVGENDYILLSDFTVAKFKEGKWVVEVVDENATEFSITTPGYTGSVKPKKTVDATVPVGVGIWYVCKETDTAPTVTWNN